MRPIPQKMKNEMLGDPLYMKCLRAEICKDHACQGRITLEHVWIYAGRQINEIWAIIPLCAYAHSVDLFQDRGILNKEINEWLSINRMTEEDMQKYDRKDWKARKAWLNRKYGEIVYK